MGVGQEGQDPDGYRTDLIMSGGKIISVRAIDFHDITLGRVTDYLGYGA
jgi:hypothetical protein